MTTRTARRSPASAAAIPSMTTFVSRVTQSEEELAPILHDVEKHTALDRVFVEDVTAARASLRRMLSYLDRVTA